MFLVFLILHTNQVTWQWWKMQVTSSTASTQNNAIGKNRLSHAADRYDRDTSFCLLFFLSLFWPAHQIKQDELHQSIEHWKAEKNEIWEDFVFGKFTLNLRELRSQISQLRDSKHFWPFENGMLSSCILIAPVENSPSKSTRNVWKWLFLKLPLSSSGRFYTLSITMFVACSTTYNCHLSKLIIVFLPAFLYR